MPPIFLCHITCWSIAHAVYFADGEFAIQVARESVTLLKNDGILPLNSTYKNIVLSGPTGTAPIVVRFLFLFLVLVSFAFFFFLTVLYVGGFGTQATPLAG